MWTEKNSYRQKNTAVTQNTDWIVTVASGALLPVNVCMMLEYLYVSVIILYLMDKKDSLGYACKYLQW